MPQDFPSRIGKYPVQRQIGRGATSSVYLATDPFNDRLVAVKVFLLPETRDARLKRRYRNLYLTESALVGKLSHPYIVTIYDAVEDESGCYIVMEYVPGGTLEYWTDVRRLLPYGQIVEIMFKCSQALWFAAQRGVIHRDIKPANILGSEGTSFKVSDFGSALTLAGEQTQVNGIGSPAYMSPEQIRDEPLTQQTDIYSLGVVMYQLLTGKLPFQGSSHASLLYQIVNIDPLPPSDLRPGLPHELDDIVLRAMAKKCEHRYADWQQFASALAGVVAALAAPQADLGDTEKYRTLRALAFCREFDEPELWEMLRIARWRRFAAGTVIIREGDQGDCFYVLVEGDVRVSRAGVTLNVLRPGDCFGEMLYFSAPVTRRTTTITALQSALVIEIKAASLNQASDACQVKFNRAFLRILLERLTFANARLAAA
jgi:CRP-like cAMP-binding protein